jgi:hypothetical protein
MLRDTAPKAECGTAHPGNAIVDPHIFPFPPLRVIVGALPHLGSKKEL